ncbi:efflux transporter outer membrane subunit [Thermomonas carbonis]|uniref:Efflux transporter outer membrane subunit n=1 Tax=Thermomonas carbonis TaxID=1463158 RepID=A0A7G9SQ95_9GAMM|nr:efflux transporter outer membrane subunit [Thermomonas carbonis]QNN70020.1 efflux transporter outer membrane subunit [Thermomonas carbonis]GHB97160.1 multidrug RND transporter [Thermomonas carbonis]
MSRLPLLVTALATALLATACASTGDIAPRGVMRDAGSLRSAASLAGTRVSDAAWPSDHWWAAFGDPQLDALVDEALANAPSIEAADARTRNAIAQAGLADAARKPTLGAGAQVLGAQVPPALVGDEIGGDFKVVNALTLSFAWNPDLWGMSRSKWQAAVGSARAAEVDAQSARVALAANVARSYVSLARAFDALDAANAEARRADALIALNQQRINAGLDNTIALNQNRSAAATARQQAQAAQHDIDALRNALAALLGAGPDRGIEIARPALKTPGLALPSVLPSELLARRADIVAARWRVEAAQHGIDASKAAFYPSINLSALAGLAAGNLGDLFGSDALLLNGGPALSLPIFEGGRLEQQLRSSDADRDLAVATYDETLIGAIRDVANAVQAARAMDAQITSTTIARDAAAKAHALVSQRQRAGLATQLDVLAAQAPLLKLDQQLAALIATRRIASIDLDQALGGGIAIDAPIAAASH